MVDLQTWLGIQQLYADYAIVVDSGQWDQWPEFFTDSCVYKIQPRENHERGFPLATLFLSSKGMLKDRVYGITETIYHDPYYQRHVVSAPVVRKVEDGRIQLVYDFSRTGDREILFATFREEDVLAGKPVSAECKLRQTISRVAP